MTPITTTIKDWETDVPNHDFRMPSLRDYAPEDYPTPEPEEVDNDNQDDTQPASSATRN